jgi:hypothetical protein
MRRARLAPAAALALVVALSPSRPAAGEAPATVALGGILRGATLAVDGYWKWKPTENRTGVLGNFTAAAKEFEQKDVEIGADRSVFTAAQRCAYEMDRVCRTTEYGESHEFDLKPTVAVARFPLKGVVYACAAKQMGRTALYAKAAALLKEEAGLVRLVTTALSTAKTDADEVDGWIPPEVKTVWNRVPAPDLIAIDDGTLKEEDKTEILKVVRDAHALVKRLISGSPAAPFAPVVRMTTNRDLFSHLAKRRDAGEVIYVAEVGELLVGAKTGRPDPEALQRAALDQMLHHSLGGTNAEPIRTGVMRYAQALREGATAGDLLPSTQTAAVARLKAKTAQSWLRILTMPTVAKYLNDDVENRSIDAELNLIWLVHGGSQGKGSWPKWVTGFRKWGHPDAAAEEALRGLDGDAANSDFWKFWDGRLAAMSKPKPPGKPGSGAAPTKPPK